MTEATRAENRPRTPEADRGGAQSGDARTSARAAGCCSHHHPHGEVETQANLAVQSSNRDSSDHAHAPHSHANGDHPHDHDHDHDHDGAACCAPAPVAFAPLPGARKAAGGRVRSAFRIMQMDCPTEETLIRKKLGAMSEVAALEFNLMQRMLAVEHVPGAEAGIAAAIRSLGMTPEQADAGASGRGALPAPADAPRPWW
ncbi:heavy metal translocating P-type ATPase, partial [Burkholderia pseudomallei]|nr:heavy metal translocating P-type ATPase [Burkholderia pseudomallei]